MMGFTADYESGGSGCRMTNWWRRASLRLTGCRACPPHGTIARRLIEQCLAEAR